MPVIDASLYVAAHVGADRNHGVCLHWLERNLEERARLAAPVLLAAEVAAAIRRLTGDREEAEQICSDLFTDQEVELYPLTAERGRHAAKVAASTGVRGADAIYLALAQELDTPLITLDRQQLERGPGVARVEKPRR